MTTSFTWFGLNLRESKTDDSGKAGAVINGYRFLNDTIATGNKIAAAGAAGLDRYEVPLTHVQNLQRAGVSITSDPCGSRWFLTAMPTPDHFLIEVHETAAAPKQQGQYGSGPPKPWGVIG